MYYQSKRAIQWKKKDYSRTILLFALHTFIIIALYAVMLFVNAYRGEVNTSEFLTKPETIRKLLYVAIAVILLAAGIYLYFYNENRDFILRSKNIHLVALSQRSVAPVRALRAVDASSYQQTLRDIH